MVGFGDFVNELGFDTMNIRFSFTLRRTYMHSHKSPVARFNSKLTNHM